MLPSTAPNQPGECALGAREDSLALVCLLESFLFTALGVLLLRERVISSPPRHFGSLHYHMVVSVITVKRKP